MGKHKGDIEIGHRTAEEILRIFGTNANAIRQLGLSKKQLYTYLDGCTPGGFILAKLHYHGCDVLYVLTGKRGVADG